MDHFEVKEVNKDLIADTQAEDSEAEGGFQEEDGIRTGSEETYQIPGGKKK